ncbi:MAG: hypothetical protein KAS32_23345 [Candidatus Peribacteraceae bacterium]|nr:hypothetical protein [Candidatus Peribacteraceae bacterium]
MTQTLYTAQHIRKDDVFYGPTHGSDDGDITVCQQKIDENWFIINNDSTGVISCKKCLESLENRK